MWRSLSFFLLLTLEVSGAPLPSAPTPDTVKFMKKYGYLVDSAGPESDSLFTEEGFKAVVKQMQKYGGLEETGQLDEITLKLMETPRCGVPDVMRDSQGITTENGRKNRTKRYIIGSEGWKKRKITYFLSNWGDEMEPDEILPQLEKAFQVWSEVTPLKFSHVRSMDADLIIAFGRGHHGDRYAFDGPGNTLAHAFFPYQHDAYGGDIHFDDDEIWTDESKSKRKDGIDFFTVATHEIGHSLGLAHSTTPMSVMFPYYKGYNENFRIGYDDVLAMYDLYVRNQKFEDNYYPDENDGDYEPRKPEIPINPTTSTTTTSTTTTTPFPSTKPPSRRKPAISNPEPPRIPTIVPKTNTTKPRPRPTRPSSPSTTTTKPTTLKPDPRKENRTPGHKDNNFGGSSSSGNRTIIPDICQGPIDAVANLRNELFFFHKEYMWRMKDRGIALRGYPVPLQRFFVDLPKSIRKIDAIYQRTSDYNVIIFTGNRYWTYNGDTFTTDSPQPLSALGLPSGLKKVDAAMVWGKNQKTYFFSGEKYWRYDDTQQVMEEGYPLEIKDRWQGIPTHLDSAFTWTDGQTYFFKGLQYWRFNNEAVTSDENFPRNSVEDWLACGM